MTLTRETFTNVYQSIEREGLEPLLVTNDETYNISVKAVREIIISDRLVSFKASFKSEIKEVIVPMEQIQIIIANIKK